MFEYTPPQYRKQLTILEDQAQDLEATLSRRSAFFRTESQPVTIEAVQNLIPSGAALVELVLYHPFNLKAATPAKKWGTPPSTNLVFTWSALIEHDYSSVLTDIPKRADQV